jgi:hypothetical protein
VRARDELEAVMSLAREGRGASEIANRTGIPRSTVRDWLAGHAPRRNLTLERAQLPQAPYSHLLGLYLGDGHIARLRRTYMLRVFFDAKYPGLIGDAVRTVRRVCPDRKVSVARTKPSNCVVLRCYWGLWPEVFPQHGRGAKHLRPIELVAWQREITHAHPREFVRGLINSDGSRFINPVRHGDRLYTYSRYSFCNASDDIRGLFCEHLDLLGIAWRPVGRREISIARREAVAALDEFVGPKR